MATSFDNRYVEKTLTASPIDKNIVEIVYSVQTELRWDVAKGSYSGGSTIIKWTGRFTSYDEAESDRTEISSEKYSPRPKPHKTQQTPKKVPNPSPSWVADIIAHKEVGINKGNKGQFFLTVRRQLADIPGLANLTDLQVSRGWNALGFTTSSGRQWTPELVALARKHAARLAAKPQKEGATKGPKRTGRILKPVRNAD